ncbi:MAG: PilZ domain-containing protein [Acidimicrobiales bacterium]
MSVIEVERREAAGADRRRWPRARVRLPVRVVDTEGGFGVRLGETVDLSVGGLLALVDGPLGGTIEATVQVDLPDGPTVVCQALVASGGAVAHGWEYRLAFRNLDPHEIRAIEQTVDAAA